MALNLMKLLKDVFNYKDNETITIFYDIPKQKEQDNKDWEDRRKTADDWHRKLSVNKVKSILSYYDATGSNNADLPEECFVDGKKNRISEQLLKSEIIICLTEFSPTAPMKEFAKKFDFRAATMPGFNNKMLDALALDYTDVAKKVSIISDMLSGSESIKYLFEADGKKYSLLMDIRFRKALKDDGDCRLPKTVINLPSGEAFISPYEGEKSKSNTEGFLPIENSKEVIIYKVSENKIVDSSKKNDPLMDRIKNDPAIGNLAEGGFGVLGMYGIKACGEVLLDEKLGAHIALGRDDHFGGITSPKSFKFKENVWHQDFVYIKEMQPSISVREISLSGKILMKNNKFRIF